MASYHFQQTIPSQASDMSEPPRPDTSDTVHHGPGPHSFLPPHQCQEDPFTRALDFIALASQFPFTLPHNAPLWNTQVDWPPISDRDPPSFPNDGPASPTSPTIPSPFPTTGPFPLPNADQFTSWSFQDLTTPTGGFPSQEVIHREEPSVHNTFPSIWDKNYLVSGQMATLHDQTHQHTLYFESPSPESYLAEDMSSLVSNEMTTRRLDTPPVGSKRARTPSDLPDEPQSKRIRWDSNTLEYAPAPTTVTESGVVSHPHPSTLASPLSPPPTEEVEPIREFKKGNRCGHNGCGKWHTDTSIVSRHRRAHMDRYPCPNPNCKVITTTYRSLQRHWANPRGWCSAYKRGRKECLVSGQANVEVFNPKIHRPYKSLKLKHGKHVNKTAT